MVLTLIDRLHGKQQSGQMELSDEQFEKIKDSLPIERGNVTIEQRTFLNAVLYVVENGCKWRRLPKCYGKWHTLYTRMNRWSKAGMMDRIFCRLQEEGVVAVQMKVVSLDSTSVKVHPDAAGALKKTARKQSGKAGADGIQKYIWLPQLTGMR